MPDLLEEKYMIASLLANWDLFTLEDLKRSMQNDQESFAATAVVDDLLERACIAESQRETLVFNPKTLGFSPTIKTVYTVLPEQRAILSKYIKELETQHFQPGAQGKPRGPHFLIVEDLLENALANPETFQQEKDALIEYIALAQEEEMSEHLDLRQREISEAYIRMLYGKFLVLQELWGEAILQLLTASQLFKDYNLEDMRRSAEEQAYEVLTAVFSRIYLQATESENPEWIGALQKVQQEAERVKAFIHHDEQAFTAFSFLITECLQKIDAFIKTTPHSSSIERHRGQMTDLMRIKLAKTARVEKAAHLSDKEKKLVARANRHITSLEKNMNEREEHSRRRKEQHIDNTTLQVFQKRPPGVATKFGEYVMKKLSRI